MKGSKHLNDTLAYCVPHYLILKKKKNQVFVGYFYFVFFLGGCFFLLVFSIFISGNGKKICFKFGKVEKTGFLQSVIQF